MILGELGVNLGPLIAGAGIAGVAIGFGAQSLVKDFLSGIFMLVEDQYGVGDIIDAGEATGTVEAVTLRTTRLRDVDGTVWHVPNGTIDRVGNMSQQWARALLDVDVAYGTDVDEAQAGSSRRWPTSCGDDPDWRRRSSRRPRCGASSARAPTASPSAWWSRPARRPVPGHARAAPAPVRRVRRRGHRDARPSAVWVRRDAGSSHEVDGDGSTARRRHPTR